VSVTDARGRPLTTGHATGLGAWLAGAAPASARGEVSVAVVPDGVARKLNRAYRGRDYAADVLSFPGASFLGDIAIARGVAARQARALGHSTRAELRILALHGLLHLLGYDHETDRGEMQRAEDRLRRKAGLPAGLIGMRPGRTTRR
jgi:probable rRNA maturation factor